MGTSPVGRKRTVTVLEEVYSGAGWPPDPEAEGGAPQGLGAHGEGPMARDSQALLQRASAAAAARERQAPGPPTQGETLSGGGRLHTVTILEEVFPDEAGAAHAMQGHAADVLGGWPSGVSGVGAAGGPSRVATGLTVRARQHTETARDEDDEGFGTLNPYPSPFTAHTGAWAQAPSHEGAVGGQLPGSQSASTLGSRAGSDALSSLSSADSAHAAAAESAGMAQLRKMGLLGAQQPAGQGPNPFSYGLSHGSATQGRAPSAGQAHDQPWVHQAAARRSYPSPNPAPYRRAASVPVALDGSAPRTLDLRRVTSVPARSSPAPAADPGKPPGAPLEAGRRRSAPMRAAQSMGLPLAQHSKSAPPQVTVHSANGASGACSTGDANPGVALQRGGAAAYDQHSGRAHAGEAGGLRDASLMQAMPAPLPPLPAAAYVSAAETEADRRACPAYQAKREHYMTLKGSHESKARHAAGNSALGTLTCLSHFSF